MEIDRKELKRRAREAMAQSTPHFRIVALVFLLMGFVPDMLVTGLQFALISNDSAGMAPLFTFFTLLLALYGCVVQFGYTLWSLWTSRRLTPGLGALLDGFSVAGRVLWMEVLITVRFLLLCLPVAMLFSLVMALLGTFSHLRGLTIPLFLIAFLALYVCIYLIYLRYSLAPYCLADHPDQGAGAAVRRSISLMRGWLMELFKLHLSFLGWALLFVLLQGGVYLIAMWHGGVFHMLMDSASLPNVNVLIREIAQNPLLTALSTLVSLPVFLWLVPYYSVTIAGFYDARVQLGQSGACAPSEL